MDSEHVLHRHPVWRDRANYILDAVLDEGIPGRFEQLWARKVAENEFEICCTPFFVYDMALGDVVRARTDGSGLVDQVVRPSGRYVFRAYLAAEVPFEDIFTAIEQRGWQSEWYSPRLVAVDAVDSAQAREVADHLAQLESQQRLTYETGRQGRGEATPPHP